jgi:hypothetical protein
MRRKYLQPHKNEVIELSLLEQELNHYSIAPGGIFILFNTIPFSTPGLQMDHCILPQKT